jgi:hypothetical protein
MTVAPAFFAIRVASVAALAYRRAKIGPLLRWLFRPLNLWFQSGTAWQSFPMLDEGFWAEIKVGGEHLRLFSERNALGMQTSVYNVNTKTWIAPSETVEDVEQGKERAVARAEAYLKQIANLELPTLVWKRSRSA